MKIERKIDVNRQTGEGKIKWIGTGGEKKEREKYNCEDRTKDRWE